MAKPTVSFWKTPMALGCFGVIALAGAVVAVNVATHSGQDQDKNLPTDLTVSALTKATEEGNRAGMFREIMDREDLTDDQRREAFRNMRRVFRKRMDDRIAEYFDATSQEEKQAILDQQIDEFATMREQWRRRQKQRQADRDKNREKMQKLFQTPSRQERKSRSENRNPDQTARRMAYFSAMRSRMSERGINLGGGRGGFGGGRRGGSRRP